MDKDLNTMAVIQNQKAKDMAKDAQQPLDAEGRELAEKKRWTLDIPEVKLDPLR